MFPEGTCHALSGHKPVLAAMPEIVSPERTTTLYPLPVVAGGLGCVTDCGAGVGVGIVAWLLGLAYLFHCSRVPRK